jgi:dihydroanticapsin dehydrogenase
MRQISSKGNHSCIHLEPKSDFDSRTEDKISCSAKANKPLYPMRGLKDKIVIITGGLGDLGYASGKRLVEEGCQVALFDQKVDSKKAGAVGCQSWEVDITEETQIEKACLEVKEKLGLATVLVNSAAIFILKSIEATPEDWDKMTRVNIRGASLMAKHVVPQMKEAGHGSIINFSSVSGFVGQPNFCTYTATKFAIRGLTRGWATDLSEFNIRVNTLCPGYIYTSAFVNSCKDLGLDIDEENKKASAMHLLGRQGKTEEIGSAVAFLASEEASFMTGSDMIVDGGYLAR